ncbi:hypothetical protein [Chitinophaga sp. 212800010-3]|uniref:hypothetical protein n=1 Tax=unclassified Chitinophaga TaxID=2619133 RepID=UPI002DF14B3B|nr:hypothetical protein [Chitinophaga sp. 212800010-3]
MTCYEIWELTRATIELPQRFKKKILSETGISEPTFYRIIKPDDNSPLFYKYSIWLSTTLVLEVIKPYQDYFVGIPIISVPRLSRRRPIEYIYSLLADLSKTMQTEFSKRLEYPLHSYFRMERKGFTKLSSLELKEFRVLIIDIYTDLLAQITAIAKFTGVASEPAKIQVKI